ncbi:MAG: radical SAM protein [Candidatus Methanofastidiosia archaeon]
MYCSGYGDLIPDVLFVFPPAPRKYDFAYHLGAGYVRSYLQDHTIETDQYITTKKQSIPAIVDDILAYAPDIVGFTCYDANYPYIRLLTKYIKKKSNPLVVLGGPTPTFSAQTIMEHTPEIDICINGEGEEPMLELVNTNDFHIIKGITFRSGDTIVSTPPRQFITSHKKGAELDCIPSPYITGLIPPDGKTGILTARGCVYHCTYCNFSIMFDHTIRYHSIKRVLNELILINECRPPETEGKVMIHDDIFSLNIKRAKMILQKIIDAGIDLPLSLETRADNCDKELIELMKEAGIFMINFGLESASLPVLKAVKKAPDEKKFLNQVKKTVAWAQKYGIKTSVSTIFGLPKEGIKEAEKTLDFVKELQVDEYYHNVLFLFAGTELFETRKQYGLDVTHSPMFLPYETHYAYNVKDVEPLPHAGLLKQINMWKKTYCDLLTYGMKNEDYFAYLVIQDMPESEKAFEWLHTVCTLYVSVMDVKDIGKSEVGTRIKTLLKGGVPVGFYTVIKGEGIEQRLHLYSQTELHTDAPVIPYSEWNSEHELVSLDSKKDIQKFFEFVKEHTKNGIVTFLSNDVPHMIVHACRWTTGVCPALSRGCLVVDNKNVYSCVNGGKIGEIGSDIDILRDNVKNLIRKTEEKRQCAICSVYNECSRCLFPGVADGVYCQLKREYRISKVISVLEWLYKYSDNNKDKIISLRITEDAPPLFYTGEKVKDDSLPVVPDTVTLFSCGGTPVVFTGSNSFSLDPVKAALLEACELRIKKECVSQYMDSDITSIDDVLFVFKTLGIVQ